MQVMKNISIRSTLVLSILGLLAAGFMILVEFTKKEREQPHFEEKLEAANLMYNCLAYLKENKFKDEIAVDNINDPNDSRIIGTRFSPITSGRGSLPIKLSTVNSNFAALAVQLYKDAGLKKGDHIAIGATGSFPCLNIAASAAAEVMGLEVSFISSVSSSSWGANDPEFAYPDMHAMLQEAGLFHFPIQAASIGGNQDIGRTLSPEGRDLALDIIKRNDITPITGASLEENIQRRVQIIEDRERSTNKEIELYVNIGGGIASLGSSENAERIPAGIKKNVKLSMFPDKRGVMFEMASRRRPFVNLLNVQRLMTEYELPRDPVPLPPIGEGLLFTTLKYDLRYVFTALGILVLLIVGVIFFDKRQNALGNEVVHTQD